MQENGVHFVCTESWYVSSSELEIVNGLDGEVAMQSRVRGGAFQLLVACTFLVSIFNVYKNRWIEWSFVEQYLEMEIIYFEDSLVNLVIDGRALLKRVLRNRVRVL